MAYETLLVDQSDAVLTITVNRPEVLNAQSRFMREELDSALARAYSHAGCTLIESRVEPSGAIALSRRVATAVEAAVAPLMRGTTS